jgi:uncharacterized repeat protein (TIGR03803 family)
MLHSFSGVDGEHPFGGLIMDAAGNLYGTTAMGGKRVALGGVAFEISSVGTYSVLYNFCSLSECSDGQLPFGGLAMDRKGNLYGTTSEGGASKNGTVFELSKSGGRWTETVLHSFAGGDGDGACPMYGSLTLGTTTGKKNETLIFGVTTHGGASDKGTAFELVQATKGPAFTVLHSFSTRSAGTSPFGTLLNVKGKLFGTTAFKGSSCCGTVFELTRKNNTWVETVLYSFTGGGDGGYPYGGVVADSSGNLYGVAYTGGRNTYGVVFKVKP